MMSDVSVLERRPLVVPSSRRPSRGFTLLEMSIVLVIIGVITSAVMIGGDVLRHAKGQNAFSTFVVGWSEAFAQFGQVTNGRLPGIPPATHTQFVRGAADLPLCGTALSDSFLRAGIRIPQGMGNDQESRYRYQDSNGVPQTLDVCFVTSAWSVQDNSTTTFVAQDRHLMMLTGLTSELAIQMDVLIDGNASARFGQFRMFIPNSAASPHSSLTAAPVGWGAVTAGNEDSARTMVTALFEMH